jgi:hypothetical protein
MKAEGVPVSGSSSAINPGALIFRKIHPGKEKRTAFIKNNR